MLEIIRKLCTLNGITQKELTEAIGIGKKSLLNWDKHSPLISNVILVADYFGVSLDYICGRTKNDEIMALFNSLNQEGQEKVLAYINDLCSAGIYAKKNNTHRLVEEA